MKAVLNLERRLRAVHPSATRVVPGPHTLTATRLTGSLASPYILPIFSPYFATGHLRGRTYHSSLSQRYKGPALVFTDSLRRVETKQGIFGLTCCQTIYIFTCKIPWNGVPTTKLDSAGFTTQINHTKRPLLYP
jgi:hypothetical protein